MSVFEWRRRTLIIRFALQSNLFQIVAQTFGWGFVRRQKRYAVDAAAGRISPQRNARECCNYFVSLPFPHLSAVTERTPSPSPTTIIPGQYAAVCRSCRPQCWPLAAAINRNAVPAGRPAAAATTIAATAAAPIGPHRSGAGMDESLARLPAAGAGHRCHRSAAGQHAADRCR